MLLTTSQEMKNCVVMWQHQVSLRQPSSNEVMMYSLFSSKTVKNSVHFSRF